MYRERVLPHLMDWVMRNRCFEPARRRVGKAASGRVLEIGAGGGMNLPYYSDKVTTVFGLDPSRKSLEFLERRGEAMPFEVRGLPGIGEAIPLEDGCVDSVVTTLTLCSVSDHDSLMAEIRRVLRPGGIYLFAEHGRSPEPGVARWQDRLTPCTRMLGGGCHMNYPIDRVIGERGFVFDVLETGYCGRLKPAMYMYTGQAKPG